MSGKMVWVQAGITYEGQPVTTVSGAMMAAEMNFGRYPVRQVEDVDPELGIWNVEFTPAEAELLDSEGALVFEERGYEIVAEMA